MAYKRQSFPLSDVLAGIASGWFAQSGPEGREKLFSYMKGGPVQVPFGYVALEHPISTSLKLQFPELYQDALAIGLGKFKGVTSTEYEELKSETAYANAKRRFAELLAKIAAKHPETLEVARLPEGDQALVDLLSGKK